MEQQQKGLGRGQLLRRYANFTPSPTTSPQPRTEPIISSSQSSSTPSFANLKTRFDELQFSSDDESHYPSKVNTRFHSFPNNSGEDSESLSESSIHKHRQHLNSKNISQRKTNEQFNFSNFQSYMEDSQTDDIIFSDFTLGQMIKRMENSCGIIHGNIKCEPVSAVSDLILHRSVHSTIASRNIKDLTRSQMYGIPVLLQRRNLLLIGPPLSGKTFACVLSMMNLLFDEKYYKDLPVGNGPRCVFLTSNSKNVKEAGRQCSIVVDDKLQVLTAYGGGLELERTVNLTNGCDILVTTPRCWLRLLQAQSVTNINRLSHIVFDDSDILLNTLKKEVKIIFLSIKRLLENRKKNNCSVGIHVAMVGEKWTPSHDECLNVIDSPVVSITSHLEAALYSRIIPITHIIPSQGKLKKLLDLLEKSKELKTVIVCRSAQEVTYLRPLLPYNKDKLLVTHEGINFSVLRDTCTAWEKNPHCFMLCSDAVLGELAITNAQHLVHYSLPDNKSYFSERFSTIQTYFNDRVKNLERAPAACWVNILIDDQNVKQFPEIISFLERLNMQIPPTIKQITKNIRRKKEEGKENVQCCENLLMFGICKNVEKCKYRHIFIKEKDSHEIILSSGYIKMKLLYIHNPSHYSARVLALKEKDDEPWKDFKTNYGRIALKLASYYSHEKNRIPHGKVNVGDLVCVEVELRTLFKRGVVTEILKIDEKGNPTNVNVHLIDEGSIKKYKAAILLHLPPDLQVFKPEAYDIFICGIQPVDYDPKWSTASTAKLQNGFRDAISDVDDYFFITKVEFSVGTNMIATSFLCYEWLKTNKCYRVLFSPRKFMLDSHFAEANDQHLPTLLALAIEANLILEKPLDMKEDKDEIKEDKDEIKEDMDEINEDKDEIKKDKDEIKKDKDEIKEEEKPVPYEWASLEMDEIALTNLTCCVSPSLFYLKLLKNNDRLNSLEKELGKTLNNKILKPSKIYEDLLCATINPATNVWNRASVLEILEDDQVDLFFVDYGDTCITSVNALSSMPKEFISSLPFQAVECSLVGISQSGTESDWVSEAADLLYSHAVNDAGEVKLLHARVCQIEISETSDCNYGNHYKILLYDSNDDILINKELIINAVANWANDVTKTYIKDNSYLKSLKEYKFNINEMIEAVSEDVVEYSSMDCISDNEGTSSSDDKADFNNSVWTEEMCIDPERSKKLEEIINKETSMDPINLDNIIETLTNGDFDIECSFNSLKDFSKDVVDYLPPPLQNMLKGKKVPKAIEGQSSSNKEKSSSSGEEPASSATHSDCPDSEQEILSDKSEEESKNDNHENRDFDTNELIILFEHIASKIIGKKLEVLKPPVVWSQTDFTVKISIDLPDIKDYLVYTCFQRVIFKCPLNEKMYAFELKLFGPVHKEKTKYTLHGQSFEIKMEKVMPGAWPRLVFDRNLKTLWIKADANLLVPKKSDIIEQYIQRGETTRETPEEYEQRMQLRKWDALNPHANIPEIDSDFEDYTSRGLSGSSDEEYD